MSFDGPFATVTLGRSNDQRRLKYDIRPSRSSLAFSRSERVSLAERLSLTVCTLLYNSLTCSNLCPYSPRSIQLGTYLPCY